MKTEKEYKRQAVEIRRLRTALHWSRSALRCVHQQLERETIRAQTAIEAVGQALGEEQETNP